VYGDVVVSVSDLEAVEDHCCCVVAVRDGDLVMDLGIAVTERDDISFMLLRGVSKQAEFTTPSLSVIN